MVLQASQENLQASADPAGYLLASPPGTVLPVPGEPLCFDVKGSREGGDWWYRVFIGDRRRLPRCECAYHRHRLLGTNIPCRHLRAALACPVCGGMARWRPNGSVHYVDPRTGAPAMGDIPLVCCMGSGTRQGWEREGRFVPAEVPRWTSTTSPPRPARCCTIGWRGS
jgi:hypothetical protein